MPLHCTQGLHLLNLRGQSMSAVLALLRQYRLDLVDSFDWHQGPMRSAMAGLSARLPPALLSPTPLARLTGQSIGGRWLGGVCGVLFAQRQLALQIRDVLLGIRDLLLLLGDLFGLAADLLILLG
jgi:hypothetical protein